MPEFLKGVYTNHWRIKWRCRAVLTERNRKIFAYCNHKA